MECAQCEGKECYAGKDCSGIEKEVRNHYLGSQADMEVARAASNLEAKFYGRMNRLEEIIAFSKKMGYTRLGIAFCIGLSEEAAVLDRILKKEEFEVSSVCCKVCGIAKQGLKLDRIDEERTEAMCNPIGQAEVLKREKTQLNIIVGLCIGHDILFSKHSEAPATTFIVKDRVLAHNPAGAVYSRYQLRRWF